MEVLRLSEKPTVTLQLGSPALFRWEGDTGYVELEVGAIAAGDQVVGDLAEFWAGQWRDWQYLFSNDSFFVSLELEREEDGRVWLRLDYHHMHTHLGVDWRVLITCKPEAATRCSGESH